MERDRLSPHNTLVIVAVFTGLTILLSLFYPTNWGTWKHWSWLGILGHFAGIGLAVFFAWGLTFQSAEEMMKGKDGVRINRSRRASYLVCVMAVLCFAVLFGLMVSTGVRPGDENESTGEVATEYVPPWPLSKRDKFIENVFFVALMPALFGVRCALGPKAKRIFD